MMWSGKDGGNSSRSERLITADCGIPRPGGLENKPNFRLLIDVPECYTDVPGLRCVGRVNERNRCIEISQTDFGPDEVERVDILDDGALGRTCLLYTSDAADD